MNYANHKIESLQKECEKLRVFAEKVSIAQHEAWTTRSLLAAFHIPG